MTRGHHEARGQTLQVPFEWPGRDFVEVVQIEYELALRRRETAEIHQMAVAANRQVSPVSGTWLRSWACMIAVPRKKVNGDTAMRP